MKKLAIALVLLPLAACGVNDHPKGDPGPPPKQVIIEKQVPVPVVCKNEVVKPQIDIDSANPDAPLEDQNATLRSTIAQMAVFINDLTVALIGCGGTVK